MSIFRASLFDAEPQHVSAGARVCAVMTSPINVIQALGFT